MDPEAAHELEDRLQLEILRAAARGEDISEMAAICLEIAAIQFPRWCAWCA